MTRSIIAAAAHDNLDDACRMVQDEIGQTDGGVAALFFTGREAEWLNGSFDARVGLMRRYVAHEEIYA